MGGGQVPGMVTGVMGLPVVSVQTVPPGDLFLCGTSAARVLIEGALTVDAPEGETRALKLGNTGLRGTDRLDVTHCALGDSHGAVLTRAGDVYTWGAGGSGALGRGAGHGTSYPELVDALVPQRTAQVACGPNFTAAVSEQGLLYMWGEAAGGALGLGHAFRKALQVRACPPGCVVRSVSCVRECV